MSPKRKAPAKKRQPKSITNDPLAQLICKANFTIHGTRTRASNEHLIACWPEPRVVPARSPGPGKPDFFPCACNKVAKSLYHDVDFRMWLEISAYHLFLSFNPSLRPWDTLPSIPPEIAEQVEALGCMYSSTAIIDGKRRSSISTSVWCSACNRQEAIKIAAFELIRAALTREKSAFDVIFSRNEFHRSHPCHMRSCSPPFHVFRDPPLTNLIIRDGCRLECHRLTKIEVRKAGVHDYIARRRQIIDRIVGQVHG